ncbi:hypothetical protein KIW84_054024 [Lathyrus oleraceus]|uniref:Uncharacterized protein n=1 Tax=Pisum sativum TaxID=3888 RepID=A0A9D5AGX7_PEA|nr:hypothetical protein KIW84_054024 [Pisum sativum]
MDASDVRNLEPFTIVKKPHSMTSLYLDPTNVKQNVDASVKIYFVPEIIGNVETSENTNKPRYVTTLSKSSMIVAERDNVDKNIRVLISQVLGIEPKTGIVPYISTSLGQTDNPTKTPLDKSDGNVSTQSPEKSEEKDDSDGTFGDLSDKEENSVEKKDQSTDIENIDDLDSDDEPIGKILSPGISKRLKRRKGKAVESSSKPSKSLKRSTSVGPTKGWSKCALVRLLWGTICSQCATWGEVFSRRHSNYSYSEAYLVVSDVSVIHAATTVCSECCSTSSKGCYSKGTWVQSTQAYK